MGKVLQLRPNSAPTTTLEREQSAALEARDRGNASAAEAEQWFTKCGLHLRNVKAELPHGQFLPWCKANGISPDQAKRWMREASAPEKREERRIKGRARDNARSKKGTTVPHLPTPVAAPPKSRPLPPEIDDDLLAAPEPDLVGDIVHAFGVISEALPRLTKAQRTELKRTLPKGYRQSVGAFFFAAK